jgi:predicted anti-sigma-YlaC factor YlaD
MTEPEDELACRDVVELVTDYLEGAMSEAARSRFEAHLAGCEGCTNYLSQMRTTIQLTGRLTEDSLPPDIRDRLLQTFRDLRDR